MDPSDTARIHSALGQLIRNTDILGRSLTVDDWRNWATHLRYASPEGFDRLVEALSKVYFTDQD